MFTFFLTAPKLVIVLYLWYSSDIFFYKSNKENILKQNKMPSAPQRDQKAQQEPRSSIDPRKEFCPRLVSFLPSPSLTEESGGLGIPSLCLQWCRPGSVDMLQAISRSSYSYFSLPLLPPYFYLEVSSRRWKSGFSYHYLPESLEPLSYIKWRAFSPTLDLLRKERPTSIFPMLLRE